MATIFEPIESSNLKGAHYDPATERALVKFANGAVYPYEPVPAGLYEEFKTTFDGSSSPGKFLNTALRGLAGARLSDEEVEALEIAI